MSRLVKGLVVVAACLAGCGSLPAAAQTLGLAQSPEVPLWRVVGALLFCCLLGAAGSLALRYRLQSQPSRGAKPAAKSLSQVLAALDLRPRRAEVADARLRLVETVRLGYQVEISLLECDGEKVLVVASPHGAFVVNRDRSTDGDVS